MSFPRYPEYKDSGVEWLGEIPTHWNVDRLKASISSCKNGIWGEEARGDESDIACVRVADFDRVRLRVELSAPTIRCVSERERTGRLLSKGDLLLEKSGGGENQPVGCIVLYDDNVPAVCSNFVARVIVSDDNDSSYWRYVHSAAYSVGLTTGSINQTSGIQNLDQDRYFNERAAFPPRSEQTAIGSFLDREAAKIDALVEEQKRLIDLLKEKRQAVISQAVTKGLDPNVQMKDSGVEWLGEVPEHWSILALSRVATSWCDGPFGSGIKSDHYTESGALVVRLQNIRSSGFYVGEPAYLDEGYFRNSLSRHAVVDGDVLIAGLGDESNLVGRACVAPPDIGVALVKADCFRFRMDQEVAVPVFVALQLNAGAACDGGRMATGSTRSRIPLGAMASRRIALPPTDEQFEIATYIEQQTNRFDDLTFEAESAMTLLQERRQALISAAVTGKIDVRGLVSQSEPAAA